MHLWYMYLFWYEEINTFILKNTFNFIDINKLLYFAI